MRGIADQLVTDVLFAFYQPLGYSLLTAFFFMFFYMFAYGKYETGKGYKTAISEWKECFVKEVSFRRLFLLVFYVMLVLFRTLMNRDQWVNPLYEVLDGWWIYDTNTITGKTVVSIDCIENLLLFIPFTFLFFRWQTEASEQAGIKKILKDACRFSFVCSFGIEMLQMIFRLGSVQISDLVYNTLGGAIGGVLYWLICRIRVLLSACKGGPYEKKRY